MALEMHERCETCEAPLTADADAFICSHECTYCPRCEVAHGGVCPNCAGELVRRPRRVR